MTDHSFSAADSLPRLGNGRVDHWWHNLTMCPTLKKVAKAVLSIFHGPQVESSFNLMKDVLGRKAGSMDISTFSSIQTCKYFLKCKEQTSAKAFGRESPLFTPVKGCLVKNMQASHREFSAKQAGQLAQRDLELSALSETRKHLQSAAESKSNRELTLENSFRSHMKRKLTAKTIKRKISGANPAPKRGKL